MMFASVARFGFNRSFVAADFEQNERVLVPLLKSQQGYQGYLEIIAGERESISVTLWTSQSTAEQGLVAIRSQLMDLFGAAMDGAPERILGEVAYADLPTKVQEVTALRH